MARIEGPTSKEICWCGIHVHAATMVIAWLEIAFASIGLLFTIVLQLALQFLPVSLYCNFRKTEKIEKSLKNI